MSNTTKIVNFYEKLKPADVSRLGEIYEEDAFFKDPFNELKSLSNIEKIFEEMFNELENPYFVFIDKISHNHQVFLTWDFVFTKNRRNFKIHGSSHLKLSESGKIMYHRDYWDVGEELLLKLPVIKSIYGALRNKLAVDS
ncbi:nuclear transport factor 2 family protein [Halobacteriovorax sp.]|uniref:nuclear transport factor 2 family protein n=1 Tax=Halobacteriovorax sp. TaxID=2020862 RepID=UPI00356625BD